MTSGETKILLERIARLCGLERYRWTATISESQPDEDDTRFPVDVAAHVDIYALEAAVTIYPSFFEMTIPLRESTLLHEVAHVFVNEYTSVAQGFADELKDVLHPCEERLADSVSRLLASACREAGVSFEALT